MDLNFLVRLLTTSRASLFTVVIRGDTTPKSVSSFRWPRRTGDPAPLCNGFWPEIGLHGANFDLRGPHVQGPSALVYDGPADTLLFTLTVNFPVCMLP